MQSLNIFFRFVLLMLNLVFLLPELSRSQSAIARTGLEWAQGAVWYQIFPERFRNGDTRNDPTAEDAGIKNYPGWQVSPWLSDWYKTQSWEKATGWPFYKFVFDRRYGGDLQGVIEKLDTTR